MIWRIEGKDGSAVKKILAFLVCLVLACSVGCGETKKDTKAGGGGSPGTGAAKP
jgi:hypothetical protein